MANKKKLIKIALVFLISISLTGCFNYKDINKVTFATSMIFDIDDLNRVQLYVESIKPYRSTNDSSDKGKRIIYKGEGKTLLEAIRDINMASSNNVNFSQNRAYIFTERAAKEGLDIFLDLVNNNQEFQIKPSLYVYYGNVQELLEITSNDEEYLGAYLNEMTDINKYNPNIMVSNINTYLNNSLIGSKTEVIGAIEVRKDALDKKIELSGSSIIIDNKLVDKLNIEDTLSLNLLMGKMEKGILEVANLQEKDKYIKLQIVDSSNETNLVKVDNGYELQKEINIKTTLGEAQNTLFIDNKVLNQIRVREEEEMKKYLNKIFDYYKEEGIDIFNIKREQEIKYPKDNVEDIIKHTNLKLSINITLDGAYTNTVEL